MPCNGVAVAFATVNLETEKYLDMIDKIAVDKVIEAYLTNLGYPLSTRQFTVRFEYGRMSVINGPTGLEIKLRELLDNLAGKMRQQVIIQKLLKSRIKISSNQVASNGARVLEVEL